jgi:hypothetical protein
MLRAIGILKQRERFGGTHGEDFNLQKEMHRRRLPMCR